MLSGLQALTYRQQLRGQLRIPRRIILSPNSLLPGRLLAPDRPLGSHGLRLSDCQCERASYQSINARFARLFKWLAHLVAV